MRTSGGEEGDMQPVKWESSLRDKPRKSLPDLSLDLREALEGFSSGEEEGGHWKRKFWIEKHFFFPNNDG